MLQSLRAFSTKGVVGEILTMTKAILLKLLIAVTVIVAVFSWLRHELKVDDCLDRGGRWNKGQMECEFGSPSPPEG